MGSRSRSSSSGSVGKTDQKSAMGMYNNLLGGQLGIIGETLGGLIEHGQKAMESNPAMANFMRAVGGQPIQLDTPDVLTEFVAKYKPQEPQTQEQRFGVAPTLPNGQPFDINNYMRNRFMG